MPVPALSGEAVRWRCDESSFQFKSTAEVAAVTGIVGQDTALEALRFGLECHAFGQNVFVRGLSGTGRMTMVQRLLADMAPSGSCLNDYVFVHNFERPDRPRLIVLDAGQARPLRRAMRQFAEFLAKGFEKALNDSQLVASRGKIQENAQAKVQALSAPLEAELKEAGLTMATVSNGNVQRTVLQPLVEGQAVGPEQFEKLIAAGKLPADARQTFIDTAQKYSTRLQELTVQVQDIYRSLQDEMIKFNEQHARTVLDEALAQPRKALQQPEAQHHFDAVIDDVIETRLRNGGEAPDPTVRYGVNIVHEHQCGKAAPVVVERSPTLSNLLGAIEPNWQQNGQMVSDYRSVRAGSLLRANGGYLIMDVRDVLTEKGAWSVLMRTLRSSQLEIIPREMTWPFNQASIQPDPIAIKVRVILMGDSSAYYALDGKDQDFSDLFKVLADFDTVIARDELGLQRYAAVLARIIEEDDLRHFDRSGVAALTEHGARIAASKGQLTARFSRIADIAREASYLAGKAGDQLVTGEHVRDAVRRTKARASLPSERFQRLLNDGTIQLDTDGPVVGQVNGLAVMNAGPLTYGFPARITATIGPGRAGVINIEDAASMSGAIHTKGFHILGGLLRYLLRSNHPLAFSASIAFEQSYGGIDGDSASGAEMCCLLSALTGIPLRQSLAMTGAIDQHGHIQAIGGVNEKIEGFFDICSFRGLTGDQGVIIPVSNAGDLMLREDVAEACGRGEFHIYAVDSIYQALELYTGMAAGQWGENGYAPDSMLGRAVAMAEQYWQQSASSPGS